MAGEPTQSKTRSKLWWLLAAAPVLIVIAAALWFINRPALWTNDGAISVDASDAVIRRILWTPPVTLDETVNSEHQEYEPFISSDGTELYFVRGMVSGGQGQSSGGADIYRSVRANNAWAEPQPLESINTEQHDELSPRLSQDGNTLYFSSNRKGGEGGYDLWAAERNGDGFEEPVNLGPAVNSPHNEYSPAPTPDGKTLFFATNRKAAALSDQKEAWPSTIRETRALDYDIFKSVKSDAQDADGSDDGADSGFNSAVEVDALTTEHREGAPIVSPVGDFLYFISNRPDGFGKFDMYRARISKGELIHIENLGPQVNTADNETDPALAMGGFRLVFSTDRDGAVGGYDLFTCDSREVYETQGERALPDLGFNWWLLPALLALLLGLLWFFRDLDPGKLSTLQKCLLVSLMAHLIMLLLFSLLLVTSDIVEYIREEAGMEVAVNLDVSREVEVKMETRRQISELPTSDPVMTETARTEMAVETPALPPAPAPQMNVPRTVVQPTTMTVQPTTAVKTPPVQPQKFETPAPPMFAESPAIAAPSVQRVAAAESKPVAQTDAPTNAQREQMTQVNDPTRPQETRVQTAVAPIESKPLDVQADLPSVETPMTVESPTIDLSAIVDATSTPEVDLPVDDLPNPVARTEAAPSPTHAQPTITVKQAEADDASMVARPEATQQTPQPAAAIEQQSLAAASLPQADAPQVDISQLLDNTTDSLVNNEPAPPLLADVPNVTERVRTEDESPQANPSQSLATAEKVTRAAETASPNGVEAPNTSLAVPATANAEDSLLPSVTLDLDAVATPIEQPVIDLPFDETTVEVSLPSVATKTHAEESAPVGSASDAVRFDASRPVTAGLADAKPSEFDSKLSANLEGERDYDSMLKSSDAAQASARVADGSLDIVDVPALFDPLGGSIGPGKLSAPESMHQRSIQQRKLLLQQMGGNEESEDAVLRALRYLARNQEDDGGWTKFDGNKPTNRQRDKHDQAITGLAALAFLAGDYTPTKQGEFQSTVQGAIEYILSKQKDDGDLRGGGDMYDHGIATLAIAEAALMTGDPRYREAAFKAAEFTVWAQDPNGGGWRYTPRDGGDTSVVGWQIMALHSCEQLGFNIPEETRSKSYRFLDHVTRDQTLLAGYQNAGPTPPMTAEAAFCRILLGQKFASNQVEQATQYMLDNPPSKKNHNFYYFYYGSLMLSQLNNEIWPQWNDMMREHIVSQQSSSGELDGSWDTNTQWGTRGGRIYTTSMAALTLQVYYRYLPMYRGNVDD